MDENKTPETITVTVDGEEREIKLSYGLLNEILTNVKDITTVGAIYNDPDIRNSTLESLLVERTKSGKRTGKASVEDLDISMTDIERLLVWAGSHVTGFFIRSLEKYTAQIQLLGNQLSEDNSMSTPSGSPA